MKVARVDFARLDPITFAILKSVCNSFCFALFYCIFEWSIRSDDRPISLDFGRRCFCFATGFVEIEIFVADYCGSLIMIDCCWYAIV